jgi:hypothetical protein
MYRTLKSPHDTILKHIFKVLPADSYPKELEKLQDIWEKPDLVSTLLDLPAPYTWGFKALINTAARNANNRLLHKSLPPKWKAMQEAQTTSQELHLLQDITQDLQKLLKNSRFSHLFSEPQADIPCKSCNINTLPTVIHKQSYCTSNLIAQVRTSFWNTLQHVHKDAHDFLASLTTPKFNNSTFSWD